MELPKVLAMVICDEIIEDVRTRKKSLIGLFNRISTKTLPAKHPKLHVFFVLTNGRGKYQAKLQLMYLNELKVLHEFTAEIKFEDPNTVIDFNFELMNVNFPKEGKYNFQLLLDGTLVAERVFQLSRSEKGDRQK